MLVCTAIDDAYFLGVLSCCIHVTWALAPGGTLEDRPRYNKTRCFEPFPFPEADDKHAPAHIRSLAELLDSHPKRQQQLHPLLTMAGMYNVLEKLRTGQALDEEDRRIHQQGLIAVLRDIHDELDTAVVQAYGWPANVTTEDILFRVVGKRGGAI